ncbi:MAG: response regulator [Sedimenticola thiotaurini]|uniref:Response regulator n=1 Tax=Sedimenticola thiotaurini TaxID=1543721 RepID=A0A558CUP8_9GAMM|nr:MAG: response regulator [Sedimenticola thiotaurini]
MPLDRSNPIVLVVDDSPDSLGMIHTALQIGGYTVLVALNGKQALDIVDRIQPDVVLMDAVMPVMDGFESCRQMRNLLPLTPILFMTGLTDPEHIVKAFDHGGTDYITKPLNPDELLARITAHVRSAHLIGDARAALDSARQHVISVNGRGEMLWTTPEARELLAGNGIEVAAGEFRFSGDIMAWLGSQGQMQDLIIHTPQQPLIIRYFKAVHADEHLLRIVDQHQLLDASVLEAALPVTKREAEVLLWVAQGKTNREIGEILTLSPRTVNKHLEQIYSKIQVDNRAAATSIAIQSLLGMSV